MKIYESGRDQMYHGTASALAITGAIVRKDFSQAFYYINGTEMPTARGSEFLFDYALFLELELFV